MSVNCDESEEKSNEPFTLFFFFTTCERTSREKQKKYDSGTSSQGRLAFKNFIGIELQMKCGKMRFFAVLKKNQLLNCG